MTTESLWWVKMVVIGYQLYVDVPCDSNCQCQAGPQYIYATKVGQ